MEVRPNATSRWGIIADRLWGLREAKVACRMMGFSEVALSPDKYEFYKIFTYKHTLETSLICILLTASRNVYVNKRMICLLIGLFYKAHQSQNHKEKQIICRTQCFYLILKLYFPIPVVCFYHPTPWKNEPKKQTNKQTNKQTKQKNKNICQNFCQKHITTS